MLGLHQNHGPTFPAACFADGPGVPIADRRLRVATLEEIRWAMSRRAPRQNRRIAAKRPVLPVPMQIPGLILWVNASRGITLGSAFKSSGTSPPSLTQSGSASTIIGLQVKIDSVAGGTGLGQATFKVSYDNGATFPQTGLVTSASFPLTGTGAGITLTFAAGTYNIDNTWDATVSAWADLSNAGLVTPTQVTPAFRPRLIAQSGLSSLPAVEFVNATTTFIDTFPITLGPFTIAASVKSASAVAGFRTHYGFNSVGDLDQNYLLNNTSGPAMRVSRGNGANLSTRNPPAAWMNTAKHSVIHSMDGTHVGNVVYLDNVDVSTAWTNVSTTDPGTTPTTFVTGRIGATAGGGFGFDGQIREFMIYNRSISASERATLYAYQLANTL
jgi:hypothetical protein